MKHRLMVAVSILLTGVVALPAWGDAPPVWRTGICLIGEVSASCRPRAAPASRNPARPRECRPRAH